jgi:signal transduction histidine kinase
LAREFGLAVLVAGSSAACMLYGPDPAWASSLVRSDETSVNLLLTSAAVLVCLLRLRSPVVALLAAAALFGLWPVCGTLLALTAYHVAAKARPVRGLKVVLTLAVVADLAGALTTSEYGWSIVIAGHAVALAVCLGLPIAVRVLLRRIDRVIEALHERARYLEDNDRLARSAARLQERSRIAQEMHDQLGHRLSLISLYAGALELATGRQPGEGDRALLIRTTVHTAMQELRATLGVLRPSGPSPVHTGPTDDTGTREDLLRLIAESRSAGVHVRLAWPGEDLGDAPVPVRRAVHRLVREGLTNIHRHAPGADALVTVERDAGRLRVQITNGPPRGAGKPASGTKLGLVGVRERVHLLGGELVADADHDGGYRMVADLPLDSSVEQRARYDGTADVPAGDVAGSAGAAA